MPMITPRCAVGRASTLLAQRGIVHLVKGLQIDVSPVDVERATKALSEPFGNIEPESRPRRADERPDDSEQLDPVEPELRKQIRDLQRNCDDLAEENRRLRKIEQPRDDARKPGRDKSGSANAADSVRKYAARHGVSVGSAIEKLGIDASHLDFGEAELLPTQYAKAIHALPKASTEYMEFEGEIHCALMSPTTAAKVYEQSQRTIAGMSK